MTDLFRWLDKNRNRFPGVLFNQLLPVVVCFSLYFLFLFVSWLFITVGINPVSVEKIQIELHPIDIGVGFFLYFVTAVDYALIIGRMQVSNPGSKPRFIMNVFTCLGCFAGVSIVLFLWGLAKEVAWLIIPILIFAGGVMIKLAFEGKEYYEKNPKVPRAIRRLLVFLLESLHAVSSLLTFWIPELGSPKVKKMTAKSLATWAFLLPFIIGLDDLVGYMGAMTIYNAFSLLVGIYFADILIDLLIFVSPRFTKKLVENPYLSVLASFAFLYLAYKSIFEAVQLTHEAYHVSMIAMGVGLAIIILFGIAKTFSQKSGTQRWLF